MCRIHQITRRNVSLHDGFNLLFAHEANVESKKRPRLADEHVFAQQVKACDANHIEHKQEVSLLTTLNLGHRLDHTLLLYYTVKKK